MTDKQIQVKLIDHMGSDLSVVNAARVSFSKESYAEGWKEYDYGRASGEFIAILSERDQKLIKYLAKHKHLSPFGHAFLSFHIKAPVFVARQLVKHKFLRWNEVSRRYVEDEPEFYEPDTWRGKAEDKKQGSEGVVYPSGMGLYTEGIYDHYNNCSEVYRRMVEDEGVAAEQARMVLPQSLMTEWFWSGSLDAFASMCKLRCAKDTQYESRLVADQVSKYVGDLFPVSWKSLMESDV